MRQNKHPSRILAGKPEVKRLLGRSRHRWKNIKIYLAKQGNRIWTGFIRAQWKTLAQTEVSLGREFLDQLRKLNFLRTTTFLGASVFVGQYRDNTTMSKR